MSEPTRDELVQLCTDGVVPHDRWNEDTYYIPTRARLDRADGGDWY